MLGDLFNELLHKLMTGEIRVGELAAAVVGRSQSPSTRRTNRGTHCSEPIVLPRVVVSANIHRTAQETDAEE